jgi:foldase protein PrsA
MKPAALAVASLLAAAAFAQVDPNRTVLVVNGETIKGSQYYTRMEILPGIGKLVNGQFIASTPGFLTLQAMIDEILMVQLAKKEGVTPTEAEIDAEVARRKQLAPEVFQNFVKAGLTEADFRYDTMVQVAEFKILTKGINVTDFEVQDYYKKSPRKFLIPERYTLRVVTVKDVASQAPVDAALKAGETFESIVAKFSIDEVTKADGGLLKDVLPTELGDTAYPSIKATAKGQVTPWIKGKEAYFKFKIEDHKMENLTPLDDNLKKEIRRQIMIDKGLTLPKFNAKMNDMRKNVKFDFQGGPFDETLKRLFGQS